MPAAVMRGRMLARLLGASGSWWTQWQCAHTDRAGYIVMHTFVVSDGSQCCGVGGVRRTTELHASRDSARKGAGGVSQALSCSTQAMDTGRGHCPCYNQDQNDPTSSQEQVLTDTHANRLTI